MNKRPVHIVLLHGPRFESLFHFEKKSLILYDFAYPIRPRFLTGGPWTLRGPFRGSRGSMEDKKVNYNNKNNVLLRSLGSKSGQFGWFRGP